MTLSGWLSLVVEIGTVGALLVGVGAIGLCFFHHARRLVYRLRVRHELSKLDRLSLGTLATFRRKDDA